MNSFNHYAYGAIGDWMYRVVAGLDLDAGHPGYKHSIIAPHPGGGLTHAASRLDTQYGTVASSWQLANAQLTLTTEVPPNTSATVRLPGATLAQVTESGRRLAATDGIRTFRQDGSAVVVEIGSGTYTFTYSYDVRSRVSLRHVDAVARNGSAR